jgi:hypothetical protein
MDGAGFDFHCTLGYQIFSPLIWQIYADQEKLGREFARMGFNSCRFAPNRLRAMFTAEALLLL